MQLYFSPLACSLATRIALYEAEAPATFIQVDSQTKRTADGADFYAVNPMGQVPVLRGDDGELVTENPAVLQFVADHHPNAGLAPGGGERYRLQQWLNFVTSELHKLVFAPLLDPKSPADAKAYAREKARARFAYLDHHLSGREFLLDRFTVADAYLVTVLNWAKYAGLDLSPWAAVTDYEARLRRRPSVARAFAEEFALYEAEKARKGAA